MQMLGFPCCGCIAVGSLPWRVVILILAQHKNSPQRLEGLTWIDFCLFVYLFNLVFLTCSCDCSDGFKDTEQVEE